LSGFFGILEEIVDFEERAMRADRLLSILMLLQARGHLTAQQLAEELEVSVRTIYRDVDALSAAGVPIYAERGPGGGCSLLEDYRTTLTGLTQEQVRALFMVSIPAPLVDLGVGPDLKAALLKLSAALPASRRSDEERVRRRIHLDSVEWFQAGEPVPHLQTIQGAVWEDRKLRVTYHLPFDAQAEWLVDPYGLVAKASTWYLICARNGHVRALRVSRILDAHLADERFERPADFDLAAFWRAWCAGIERSRPSYPVTVRVAPEFIAWLPRLFGEQIRDEMAQADPPDAKGWIKLTLPFETLPDARARILALGRAVEVLAPQALRDSILDYATQIVDLYIP
jgi:predicted DNA-binding transcriptional regulator YafY